MIIWPRILETLQKGKPCALVTLFRLSGSVPQEIGARMIIHLSGDFYGTIGGGALEWDTIKLARQALEASEDNTKQKYLMHTYALGPALGQCCGGSATILVETFTPDDIGIIKTLADAEQIGKCWTQAQVADQGITRKLMTKCPTKPLSETDKTHFEENFGEYRHPVLVFGAGHVAQALMLALAPLPFDVKMIDERADIFPRAMPANFSAVHTNDPLGLIASAPDKAFTLVMTHSHSLDQDIVHAALLDGRFGYVGLIGSKTKRARFESQLAKHGLKKEQLEKLVCPIGISGIKSKKPAAIAASVAAELLISLENI